MSGTDENVPFKQTCPFTFPTCGRYAAAGLSYRSFNGVVLYEPWDAQPDATDDVGVVSWQLVLLASHTRDVHSVGCDP